MKAVHCGITELYRSAWIRAVLELDTCTEMLPSQSLLSNKQYFIIRNGYYILQIALFDFNLKINSIL